MSTAGATWAFSAQWLAIVELDADGEAETETAARAITERMCLLNCISNMTGSCEKLSKFGGGEQNSEAFYIVSRSTH
jgi:hypothetical protein